MFSRLHPNRAYHRTSKLSTTWQVLVHNKRSTSSSSTSHIDETVSISVGHSGALNLRISRPIRPTNNNNVLVYLPPGPFLESSRREHQVLDSRTLRDAFSDTTVVDLEYRVSLRDEYTVSSRSTSGRSLKSQYHQDKDKDHNSSNTKEQDNPATDHRFPIPIHDVFTAWDYITDSLELYNHNVVDGKKIYYRPRICLLGSHIGGSLALSLALTNPNVVCAVAVVDAIGDWTGLDEVAGMEAEMEGCESEERERDKKKGKNVKRERQKNTEKEKVRVAAKELLRLRGRLFRSHSGYFDAFASPVLFLRAPGRDTPVEGGDVGIDGGVVMRFGEEVGEVGVVGGAGVGQAFGPYDDDWQVSGYDAAHGKVEGVPEVLSAAEVSGGADLDVGLGKSDTDSVSELSSTIETFSSTGSVSSDRESFDTQTTHPTTPSQSPPQPTSDPSTPSSPPRRRKVLRRWPPTAQPEDVLLPYVNLYTTNPSASSPSPFSATSGTPPASPTFLTVPDPDLNPNTDLLPNHNDKNHNHLHDTPQSLSVDITPVTTLQAQELQDLFRKACFWGREKSLAEERVMMTRLGGVGDGNEEGGAADGSGSGIASETEEGSEVRVGVGSEDLLRQRDREKEREQVVKWLRMRFDEEL